MLRPNSLDYLRVRFGFNLPLRLVMLGEIQIGDSEFIQIMLAVINSQNWVGYLY